MRERSGNSTRLEVTTLTPPAKIPKRNFRNTATALLKFQQGPSVRPELCLTFCLGAVAGVQPTNQTNKQTTNALPHSPAERHVVACVPGLRYLVRSLLWSDDEDHASEPGTTSGNMHGATTAAVCWHSTGELCGQTFWIKLHQRLHRLRPTVETYVQRMEESLVNGVISQIELLNASSSSSAAHRPGIRQFAVLHKVKMAASNLSTCCEGQGTRALGSLPEYVFSIQCGDVDSDGSSGGTGLAATETPTQSATALSPAAVFVDMWSASTLDLSPNATATAGVHTCSASSGRQVKVGGWLCHQFPV